MVMANRASVHTRAIAVLVATPEALRDGNVFIAG